MCVCVCLVSAVDRDGCVVLHSPFCCLHTPALCAGQMHPPLQHSLRPMIPSVCGVEFEDSEGVGAEMGGRKWQVRREAMV